MGHQMKINKNELALRSTVELAVSQLHSMQLYFFGIKNEMKQYFDIIGRN